MVDDAKKHIGFVCAYTPLALIDAAGFVPFRILPISDAPDRAGAHLHDNMCPHVKRVLDRALADDLPELAGVVIMNSCDTMRRLADAWFSVRPDDRLVFLDLPTGSTDMMVAHFATELGRFAAELSEWSGGSVTEDALARSVDRYNGLVDRLAGLVELAREGRLPGGWAAAQEVLNRSVTVPIDECIAEIDRIDASSDSSAASGPGVSVLLFGNVLPDPAAFELIEGCGCRVVADDLCTSGRQLVPVDLDGSQDVWSDYARAILDRPACARTVDVSQPGLSADQVVARARECGAKGVIVHIVKFCDPYLARLPVVRKKLREAGLPVLVLEGDCSLRSLGQHRTRIEAFAEMLGG